MDIDMNDNGCYNRNNLINKTFNVDNIYYDFDKYNTTRC